MLESWNDALASLRDAFVKYERRKGRRCQSILVNFPPDEQSGAGTLKQETSHLKSRRADFIFHLTAELSGTKNPSRQAQPLREG